jgi:hypothetical protein
MSTDRRCRNRLTGFWLSGCEHRLWRRLEGSEIVTLRIGRCLEGPNSSTLKTKPSGIYPSCTSTASSRNALSR